MSALDHIKALVDRRGVRTLVIPLASCLARSYKKSVRKISYDHGVWMHETNSGYFAYHHPFIRLDLKSRDEYARETFFWGYEPQPGDVVMDIGAGVGEETWILSRAVGAQGKIVAVEAHPLTYRCLEKLVQYNGLHNVIPVHRAIADSIEGTAMIAESDTYVGNRLSLMNGTPVRTTTIDALHRQLGLGRIHYLKMNIEGSERLAIRGMQETLKHTEVLCICCHDFLAERSEDDSLRTKNEVRQFVEKNGIRVLQRIDGAPCMRDQIWGFNEQLLRDRCAWEPKYVSKLTSEVEIS